MTLVVVTKFFPAADVRILADLGVTDVGENRHQEAQAKAADCADLGLRWHFIGGLQSNKAAAVASYADVVESVDRVKLVAGLQRGAHDRSHPVDCLLQVSLDPADASGRSGVDAGRTGRARGRGGGARDAPAARSDGGGAAWATTRSRRSGDWPRCAPTFVAGRPDATWLSAGMSADLEAAIAAGATHVRIGSAVLGPRAGVQ